MTFKLPKPGISGDYRDSCVACFQGTDTGLAFVGPAEWAAAGLQVLGVPEDQADLLLLELTGCPPGMVPRGSITVGIRVCKACAASAGMRVARVATGVPGITPPIEPLHLS